MTEMLSISDLASRIRQLIDHDAALHDLWIQGEVSNMTRARSGHWYFTLKDENAAMNCVMWKRNAARQSVEPQEGDQIAAHGHLSFYDQRGDLQFYADFVRAVGVGDLYAQYERLKQTLAEAGLFDAAHKQPLPRFPRQIGVVTSADAAAFRDVQNVLARRFPLAEVVLSPSLVQGPSAPAMLVSALRQLDARGVDVILMVRGGGSIEDLWAFNDEGLARAVFDARTPIISGVGHETDFTVVDFVADQRAPTPSAAAEIATPDLNDLRAALRNERDRLAAAALSEIADRRDALANTARALAYLSPAADIRNSRQRLDELRSSLASLQANRLDRLRERLDGRAAALEAANPEALLARGYALVTDADGALVRRAADLSSGDALTVRLADGSVDVTID